MGLFKKSVSKDLINLVRARDNGEEWAIEKLAELCGSEQVTIPELCRARVAIYEAAAKRGDKEARYWIGKSLQVLDPPASFKWLVDLARDGDARAMIMLGLGFGVVAYYGEDVEKELYWYLEAAKLGDAEGQYMAGREYYLKGMSSYQNPAQRQKYFEQASEWYEKAVEQNHSKGVLGLVELLMAQGGDCISAVDKKYNYDFANPLYKEAQEEAKTKRAEACAYTEKLLFEKILDVSFSYEDGAKALDLLGDLYRGNLFNAAEPQYELAVEYYYMANLFDEESELISEKKMNDLIQRENLVISPAQFEEWKRNALDE